MKSKLIPANTKRVLEGQAPVPKNARLGIGHDQPMVGIPNRGEIRLLQPMDGDPTEPRRIGLVTDVHAYDHLPVYAQVVLLTDEDDVAEEGDLILPSSATVLDIPLVAHSRVRGFVWRTQLGGLLGEYDLDAQPAAEQLLTSEIRTRDDLRLALQEELADSFRRFTADCTKTVTSADPTDCVRVSISEEVVESFLKALSRGGIVSAVDSATSPYPPAESADLARAVLKLLSRPGIEIDHQGLIADMPPDPDARNAINFAMQKSLRSLSVPKRGVSRAVLSSEGGIDSEEPDRQSHLRGGERFESWDVEIIESSMREQVMVG